MGNKILHAVENIYFFINIKESFNSTSLELITIKNTGLECRGAFISKN